MRILALNRRICVLYGFCSPTEESDFRAKFRQLFTIAFILINLLIMKWASAMFALHQLKMGNIVELLGAIHQLAATTTALFSFLSIVCQRQNTRRLLNGLQTIFDQCKFRKKNCFHFFSIGTFHFFFVVEYSTSAEHLYLRTNESCERNMKWAMIIMHGAYLFPGLIILLGQTTFYHVRDGIVEPQNLYMPLRTRYCFRGCGRKYV